MLTYYLISKYPNGLLIASYFKHEAVQKNM